MTATIATTAPPDADVEVSTSSFDDEMFAFLQDPIGYGTYDYGDPISLAQFSINPHFHRRYVSPLT